MALTIVAQGDGTDLVTDPGNGSFSVVSQGDGTALISGVTVTSQGDGTTLVADYVATVPDAPTDAHASAGFLSASVSFTPPASNGGAAIDHYTITSSPGGFTTTVYP